MLFKRMQMHPNLAAKEYPSKCSSLRLSSKWGGSEPIKIQHKSKKIKKKPTIIDTCTEMKHKSINMHFGMMQIQQEMQPKNIGM